MSAGGQEAHRPLQEGLQVDLPLRFRAALQRRGFLADPAHSQRGAVLDGALRVFAKEVGAGEDKRILLVVDKAGWHTGGEVEVPEGIHLEFLPPASPELQPAERLWPLSNEGVANRHFEEIEELEEALVERCVALGDQPDLLRSYIRYHWWPNTA